MQICAAESARVLPSRLVRQGYSFIDKRRLSGKSEKRRVSRTRHRDEASSSNTENRRDRPARISTISFWSGPFVFVFSCVFTA